MLDPALVEAISDVVAEEQQPKSVALRLTAWLTQMSEGDLTRDENTQFLENVREVIAVEVGDAD
ncbi:CxC ATPase DNA modification system associated small protein [Phenylobacterium sp.]|uniref:CxC ATPase DNA modification system associated small protein n=1 Tax=Phenylobacterium sp. TaxID=1871053 RepID=UPI002FE42A11